MKDSITQSSISKFLSPFTRTYHKLKYSRPGCKSTKCQSTVLGRVEQDHYKASYWRSCS